MGAPLATQASMLMDSFVLPAIFQDAVIVHLLQTVFCVTMIS